MSAPEVVDFITEYAKLIDAPVMCGTTVTSVRRVDGGYLVLTDQGEWRLHDRRSGYRSVQLSQRAGLCCGSATASHDDDADGVPQPWPAP